MFALLMGLLACGEKEATIEAAASAETSQTETVTGTTETTTTSTTTTTDGDVPTAVYPATGDVQQVAPDAGTTVSGTDVLTTESQNTDATTGDAQ